MAEWVRNVVQTALGDPAGRVQDITAQEVVVDGDVIGLARIHYTAEDFRGHTCTVEGKLYLPATLQERQDVSLPLVLHCAYEISDEQGAADVRRGRLAACTVQAAPGTMFPTEHPLARGPGMDIALAHIVRSLDFVDISKVIARGGSTGGYMGLMVAAETFPLSAAIVESPSINLAFGAALGAHNLAHSPVKNDGTDLPIHLFAHAVHEQVGQHWLRVFGEDLDAPVWIEHSPIGHLERITCPVVVVTSSADPLVPMGEFDKERAERLRVPNAPRQLYVDEVTHARAPRLRLAEELGSRLVATDVPVPPDAELLTLTSLSSSPSSWPVVPIPVPVPEAGGWALAILDEGPPTFEIGHSSHLIRPDLEQQVCEALTRGVEVAQLTSAKLEQLMDRWAGREWLSASHPHLDRPAAEQADVLRGLRAYCGTSAAHVERFTGLYQALSPEHQVLPAAVYQELVARVDQEPAQGV